MKSIRAIIVLSSFLFFYIGAAIISFVVFPLIERFTKDKRTKYAKVVYHSWRGFVRYLAKVGVLKLNVENVEQLNNIKNKIIVSTHPSYIDILILMSLIPKSTCFVKEGLAHDFVMKNIIDKIFIPSGLELDEMQRITKDYLDDGFNVVVFPSGIRHRRNEYPKIKKGTALIAMNANKDIIPIEMFTDYDFLQIGQSVLDVGDKPVTYTIRQLDEIQIKDYITYDEVNSRKNITKAISDSLYYSKED